MGSENAPVEVGFGSLSGSDFGAEGVVLRIFLNQAFASCQWCNYLESRAPAGKKPLIINMDDTKY